MAFTNRAIEVNERFDTLVAAFPHINRATLAAVWQTYYRPLLNPRHHVTLLGQTFTIEAAR